MGYGKTNEINSWQYDPKVTFSVTLENQFLLLMLAEEVNLAGIEILSLNTDGILCKVKYSQKEIYDSICKNWEELSGFTLEDTLYTKFIQTSVNDYIAETTYGSIKYKGDFEIEKEIHKNSSNKIIRIALKNYFINNIPVEETIKNHKEIFDFCIGVRAKGKTFFEYRYVENGKVNIKKLPKTIRYFISNRGGCIYKIYEDNRVSMLNVNPQKGKTWYQTIMNVYNKELINSVNFSYYIYETNKIIYKIKTNQIENGINTI